MKKLFVLPFLASLVCLLAVSGCVQSGNIKKTQIDENASIVITIDGSVLEISATTTLEDYINALKQSGKLNFEGDKGQYGLFITSIDGKANEVVSSTPNSSGGYAWNIYIDFQTLDGVIYAGDESVIYEGKALYKASYGASGIPCIENHIYAFVYERYEYKW